MGNAPKRADRLKRETIGGEEFVDAAPAVDPQAVKLGKVKAIHAQCKAFTDLLKQLGSSRSFAISRQRIEEARMWAIDGVLNERPAP